MFFKYYSCLVITEEIMAATKNIKDTLPFTTMLDRNIDQNNLPLNTSRNPSALNSYFGFQTILLSLYCISTPKHALKNTCSIKNGNTIESFYKLMLKTLQQAIIAILRKLLKTSDQNDFMFKRVYFFLGYDKNTNHSFRLPLKEPTTNPSFLH